mgnify:CR=1 FL=1
MYAAQEREGGDDGKAYRGREGGGAAGAILWS